MIKQESQYNEILSTIKGICDYVAIMTEKLNTRIKTYRPTVSEPDDN